MAITRRRCDGQGVGLSTSLQTILTFGAGLTPAGGILQGVILANISSTTRIVTLQLIQQGSTAANTKIVGRITLGPNDTFTWVGPLYANSGAFVQGVTDGGSAGDVVATAVALEETS